MTRPDLCGPIGGLVHSNVPPEISLDISLWGHTSGNKSKRGKIGKIGKNGSK